MHISTTSSISDSCHCMALKKAVRNITRFYDDAFGMVGLNSNQYGMLAELSRHDGQLELKELAEILLLDRSGLGRGVRVLERRGLLAMGPSVQDRRERTIKMTRKGWILLTKARPLWDAVQAGFSDAMGTEDCRHLREILERVRTATLMGRGI